MAPNPVTAHIVPGLNAVMPPFGRQIGFARSLKDTFSASSTSAISLKCNGSGK